MLFVIRKFFFAISAAFVMTLTLAGPTKATPVTFTDMAAFDAAVAAIAGIDSNVIDFESFTGEDGTNTGDIIASGTIIQGVTFTPTLESPFELAIRAFTGGGTSGANTLGASKDGGVSVGQLALGEVIDFTFNVGTHAFGFFVVVSTNFDFFADDVTLFAAGTSVTNPTGMAGTANCGGNCDALFIGIVDAMATFSTAKIQFGPVAGEFDDALFELDDLKFTTPSSGPGPAPVPEPGTLALFGFGLLGLGLARRRGKRV